MNKTYFDRLAQFGVAPGSGELCRDGKPGEGVDTPGIEGQELRLGCYRDTTGAANVRMALPSMVEGQSVYIGVVGPNGSISALLARLFPHYDPALEGCVWCVDQIWATPTASESR